MYFGHLLTLFPRLACSLFPERLGQRNDRRAPRGPLALLVWLRGTSGSHGSAGRREHPNDFIDARLEHGAGYRLLQKPQGSLAVAQGIVVFDITPLGIHREGEQHKQGD